MLLRQLFLSIDFVLNKKILLRRNSKLWCLPASREKRMMAKLFSLLVKKPWGWGDLTVILATPTTISA